MSIQLNNVEFCYSKATQKNILSIDSWSTTVGDRQFIYGPSGCGKSTLLNIIGGILKPTTGTVSVLGESLDKMNSHQRNRFRANNIGYIFQQFNLINYLNAEENIQLAHHFSSRKKTTKVRDKIHYLLSDLNIKSDDWSRPVGMLSVGQQQRIAIARAFVNSPQLLIADEPTSALDEVSTNNFMSQLSTLCKEHHTTLLFVSHDTRLKHHFNHVHEFSQINSKKEQ
ncbi:ABC transporter ATP-binding protein [Psychrobium sp. 1_MG-2023]|uniref:ABC transporter ATP-binding protein n=1 Tax=Psychrobium sp. 1_MG-2023 TaxID=3062624 RepID=UPI000C32D2C5|nr:ABC transporter ATP-binding protein [Psychrobium sp. 1_MG-2023]MDP2561177.1 ABC transporter ATP-binding protein [Psychrobium sp. 1_MG-2023]PKF55149.1 ABC transporter ATP-binding protein [Alteromonadales bacterium alter-6D02]